MEILEPITSRTAITGRFKIFLVGTIQLAELGEQSSFSSLRDNEIINIYLTIIYTQRNENQCVIILNILNIPVVASNSVALV